MIAVHFVDVELALLDEVVVADHDPSKGAHQAGIAREEGEQAGGVLDDVPGGADNAEEGDEESGAEDVDIFGGQTGDIVGEWLVAVSLDNGRCGGLAYICPCCNLITDSGEHEGEGCKELGGTRIKIPYGCRKIPFKLAPDMVVCRGDEDWG